jgi:hypothetical protein
MGITPQRVLEIQQYGRDPISLDQAIGDEGDSLLGDFIQDCEAVIALDAAAFTLLGDQMRSVLATLPEREAGIIGLRFGLTDGQLHTLEEIGTVYGVTRERIRQIEVRAMAPSCATRHAHRPYATTSTSQPPHPEHTSTPERPRASLRVDQGGSNDGPHILGGRERVAAQCARRCRR